MGSGDVVDIESVSSDEEVACIGDVNVEDDFEVILK
jgi:hypothetical protein